MNFAKALTLAALIGAAAPSAHAQDAFAGPMELIISSDVGGGYDSYSRTLAQHMSQYLPGEPDIIVQNMPGAGGLVATNHLANVADQDGSVFANIQRGVPFIPILGLEGAQFDPYELNWLGSLNTESIVLAMWHTAEVQTLEDAFGTTAIIGGAGQNDTEIPARVMNDILGTQFDIVSGYTSTSDIALAMERGEVEGMFVSYSTLVANYPHWIADDLVTIVAQSAPTRHPDLPHVPLVLDYVETELQQQVLDLMYARQLIGRPFVAPPGVPEETVAILREAFNQTVVDPEFIADMDTQGRPIDVVPGEDIEALFQRLRSTPPEVIDRLVAAGF